MFNCRDRSVPSCPRTKLSVHALHLGMWVLVLLATGCTGSPAVDGTAPPSPASDGAAPNLVIHDEKGDTVNVENMSEIQEAAPFDLVIPENLPLGLRLTTVSVQLPPEIIDSNDENIRAYLSFGNKSKAVGFELTESLVGPSMDSQSPNIKTLRQDGTIVKMQVNEERKRVYGIWEGCGIVFVLSGGPHDQLTEDNLLRIVEATLACQGPD